MQAIEELSFDETIERLARNGEMGAVGEKLMQERQTEHAEYEQRLAEVRQQIRALKLADHPVVRLVYPDGPQEHKVAWRSWADVPEAGKLNMLQDLVSWEGVTNRDMGHILLGELDVGKLSTGQRDLLIRLAEPEPARSKMSLDDLKRNGNGQQNGRPRGPERGMER